METALPKPASAMRLSGLSPRTTCGIVFALLAVARYACGQTTNLIQAESFSSMSGVQTENCTDTGGGLDVGFINNGDWCAYTNVDFGTNTSIISVRIASNTSGGNIQVRADAANGPLLAAIAVPGTGGWQIWQTLSASISANGVHTLFLMFTGGSGYLFNLNWFQLSPPLPPVTAGVLREVYTNITGAAVANLTNSPSFPNHPSTREIRSTFEAPTDVGDNYGQRFMAWITPPTTGNYTFWIASDDNSVLYLSTNDLPAGKRSIASVPVWVNPRQWTNYPQQQSASIPLVAGQRYYIEALMKENTGGDNLAVRWQLPDGTFETPIPDTRLQVVRIANPDDLIMRYGSKARVQVTANDIGYFDDAVQILTPPVFGTAVVSSNGTVLYTHTAGQPSSDSFTYRLTGAGGPPSPVTTVTAHFTSASRFDSGFVHLPAQPPATTWRLVDAFPGVTFSSPNNMCSVQGDPNKLFIVESAGRVWMIPDVTAASPTKTLYLNLTDRVFSDAFERGAKGVACHPGFSTNGLIFVGYDFTANGTNYIRLSKFTNSNPASEVVLFQQLDEGPYHDIDTCRFGPDGYLYVSIGDEGGQNEDYQNAQRIDKDLYSCVIRIDVDKKPGNLEPNVHPAIARDASGKAWFSVPADNPFVGAASFNHQPLNPAQVRTEIYVLGLRNPWQFNFAPGTNRLWVADVGRSAREEINLLGPGQNAGWSWREGSLPGPRTGQLINGAAETDAALTGPVLEYAHGSATNQGSSVTGGFVYQGTNYPGLNGLYIFADYVSGNIWTINPTNPAATFTRLTGGSSIVSFIPDPAKNDILLLQWSSSSGRIQRLVYGPDDSSFPPTLTDTGFFADLTDLTPNPGGIFYEPNLRFWSDYADKRRWFLIKNATDTITYSRDGNWTFPDGMIWVKHFDLDLDRGNAATSKRIETRFLVKTTAGAYGVSYKWNDAGTEAFLVPESGQEFDLMVTNISITSTQRYHIPSRSECLLCHTPQAGSALSFNTRQLNRDGAAISGISGNLLAVLDATSYLAGLNDNPAVLPRHVRPDETQYSIESRARSYLAVNCAYCHQPGSAGPPSWDGRPQLNLWETHLVNGLPIAAGANPSDRLVVPGDLNKSIVWDRVADSNGYTRMPPIATNEKDDQAIQLLAQWILTSLPARQNYDAWRLAYFGDLLSPQGEPGANPDGDADNNQAEYLKYSNPTNSLSFYSPQIGKSNHMLTIQLPNFPGRRVTVETSTDLGITDPWLPWAVAGNNGIPLAPGLTNTFAAPLNEPKRFFQIKIQEE